MYVPPEVCQMVARRPKDIPEAMTVDVYLCPLAAATPFTSEQLLRKTLLHFTDIIVC